MNNTFEDRLLAELTHEVRLAAATEAPAAPRRRRVLTPVRAGLGVATAGIAAASFLLLPGGGATPAYAVERQDDGRVLVDITTYGFDKYDELLADLRAAGVTVIEEPERALHCGDETFPPEDVSFPTEEDDDAPSEADDDTPPEVTVVTSGFFVIGDGLEWPSLVQPSGQEVSASEVGFLMSPGDTVIHDSDGDQHSLGFFSGSCE
ncbi:hypothetical protein [Streptomyces mayteni]